MAVLENDFDALNVLIGWQPFVHYNNKSKEKEKKRQKKVFITSNGINAKFHFSHCFANVVKSTLKIAKTLKKRVDHGRIFLSILQHST